MLFLKLVNPLCTVIIIVLASAYISLLERQTVAILQQRFGPSLTGGFSALLQPIADGFKLLTKEIIIPTKSKTFLYLLAPVYTFVTGLGLWALIPTSSLSYLITLNHEFAVLIILVLLILASYGPIFGGWSSNNKYALLGSYRAIALSGSYGITIGLVLILPVLYAQSFNLVSIVNEQNNVWFLFPLFEGALLFWVVMLTELKKVPFDVSESEAELSSGYLIEYSGFNFALFIIAEYASVLFFVAIVTICFLGG